MNVITSHPMELIKLPQPVSLGKYMASYCYVTRAKTRIYFTNIADASEIKKNNFRVIKTNRDEDYYVLAPNILNQRSRDSYLVICDYDSSLRYVGCKQYTLANIFRVNQDQHEIIALLNNCPEIYSVPPSQTIAYLNFYSDTNDCYYSCGIDQTELYASEAMTTGLNDMQIEPHDFVMYGTTRRVFMEAYGPKTKYVIHNRNIIFLREGLTRETLEQYLNNMELSDDISLIYCKTIDAENYLKMQLKENAGTLINYLFIGFNYRKTVALRRLTMIPSLN